MRYMEPSSYFKPALSQTETEKTRIVGDMRRNNSGGRRSVSPSCKDPQDCAVQRKDSQANSSWKASVFP